MTPRGLDVDTMASRLRTMRRLLDGLGAVDAGRFAAVPLASQQYGEYVRQVARRSAAQGS